MHLERDSTKDEAVVFIFIFATAGLLIWAAIRPWVGRWIDVSPSVIIVCSHRRVADMGFARAREKGEATFLCLVKGILEHR